MARQTARTKNRIAFFRVARKLTQQALADRVNAHWVTISKLERGQIKLTWDWMQRLAHALSLEPHELIVDEAAKNNEQVYGLINATGFADSNSTSDDDWSLEISKYISPPYPAESAWFYATEALYPPVVRANALLRFTNHPEHKEEHFLNKICAIIDASPLSLIGLIHRGTMPGFYDLEMPNGNIRRNIAYRQNLIYILTMVTTLAETLSEEATTDFE